MLRTWWMSLLVVGLAAGEARAGLDLTWQACPANGGTSNINVDCCSNGYYDLVGTFQVPEPHDCLVEIVAVLDLQVEGSTVLTPFWRFETGGCNSGGVVASSEPDELQGGCSVPSPWDSSTTNAVFLGQSTRGTNIARFIVVVYGRPFFTVDSLGAGQTYYAFHFRFRTSNATESGGACLGCRDRVAIVWNWCELMALLPGDAERCRESIFGTNRIISSPGLVSNCATWNDASSATCASTPVRNLTWGKLKTLYR